ncbi:hypothetical protein MNBD_NITROSPINAE03-2062 [hydrothermal vent metagenome]|uniref:AsmA-like C-terminal domain-containing protein n=1 Tax=hydrothermal vent metagenome TaxID=652676 RepID=A0A3B1C424_9ZZZZ
MTSPDKPSHWTPRRIVKWLFLSILALVLASVVLLTAGAFIFSYWLKTADIKPAVEWVTAKITGGQADFGSVEADLTRGVGAKKIRFKLPSGVAISVEKLDIGFDLRSLVKGSLKIDHINVERPHIIFTDTAKSAGRPMKGAGIFAISATPAIFAAPVSISLRSLSVRDLSLEYAGAGVKTGINGLNITGRGAISRNGAEGEVTFKSGQNSSCAFSSDDVALKSVCDMDISLSTGEPGAIKLKGSTGLENVSIKAPYKIDTGKVKAELDADFNIGGRLSGRSSLKVSLYGKPALNLETDWKVSKGYLEYEGRITRLNIDLKHMPKPADSADYLLSGFANFSPATIKGRVALGEGGESALSISGAGAIHANKFISETVNAKQGVAITAQLNDFTVSPKGPVSGKALVNITSPVIESSGVIVDNLMVSIEANPAGFSSGKIYISATAGKTSAKDFQTKKMSLNATLLGDFIRGDLGFIKTEISLLDKSMIAVFGSVLGYGKKGMDLTAEIQAPLKEIEPWLRKIMQVKVRGGQAQATIRANGGAGVDNASSKMDVSIKMKIRNFKGSLINDSKNVIGPADFDLYFKDADFRIDHLKTKFLGGAMTGAMRVKSEKDGRALTMAGAFTRINLGRLLNTDLGLGEEESAIDGDWSLDIALVQAGGREIIDVKKIRLSANLSRIGAKALGRFLLFLDPNKNSQSIMIARKALEYAKPSGVNISVSHGDLFVTIDLKYNSPLGGRAISAQVIVRLPIRRLVNIELIQTYFSRLITLNKTIRLAAAIRMQNNETGAVPLK